MHSNSIKSFQAHGEENKDDQRSIVLVAGIGSTSPPRQYSREQNDEADASEDAV